MYLLYNGFHSERQSENAPETSSPSHRICRLVVSLSVRRTDRLDGRPWRWWHHVNAKSVCCGVKRSDDRNIFELPMGDQLTNKPTSANGAVDFLLVREFFFIEEMWLMGNVWYTLWGLHKFCKIASLLVTTLNSMTIKELLRCALFWTGDQCI